MKTLLVILGFSTLAFASNSDQIKKLKYNMTVKSPKEVVFTIPAGHHFNAEAPSRVLIKDGKKEVLGKLDVAPAEIKASFEKDFSQNCQITSELYVCDDANTYCVPKKQVFSCGGKLVAEPSGVMKPAEAIKEARNYFTEDVFTEDQTLAFELAKKTKRLIMIDFYGIWCPPCNMLDETVFSTALFQKQKKNFVFLKLDADKPESWELKSKYNIKGYPTVMFVNAQGDEIHRIVGSRRVKSFVAEMNKAVKSKNTPMAVKKKLADGEGHPAQAYDLGMIYLNREEMDQAYYYLLKASRSWKADDPKRNDLMTTQLAMQAKLTDPESKKVLAKLYELSIQWYPQNIEVFERSIKLSELAEELDDEKLKDSAIKSSIAAAQWFIKNPKSLNGQEMMKADVYALLGDNYELLKDEKAAKEAYKQAYKEYTAYMKLAKLNEKTERGVNLQRIFCLWKSGEHERAQVLYSELEKAYPTEFTFFYQHAHLLKDAKKYDQALEKALTAFKYSYGDNRLRVAGLVGDLYMKLGQKAEGLRLVDETINGFQLPEDKNIRSHKYVERLKKLREDLKKGA